jgi:hypothetical protein
MLDDIDYSDLTATSTSAAPTSEPKKKSNIADRSVVKKQDKPARKEIDVESLSDKAKQIETDLGAPQIPDALAQYGLPALGALGALGTAYGVYKSMQNKAPTPDAPMAPAPAAGPDYSAYNSPAYLRNAPVAPPAPVEAAPAPQAVAPDRLQQAQQLAEANRQLGIGGQPATPAAPAMPPEPVATPITAAPVDAPAPTPTSGPGSPVTTIVNDTVKELIQQTPDPVTGAVAQPVVPPQELRTGTGKPAFAGMGPAAALNKKGEPKLKVDYASVADVPAGYAFVPGAQYIDTPRQNIGQLEYTKAYTDRPFPLTNEQAIQESKDINKLLGRATRAEAKAAGLPPAELTPGITKKTSAGTKPVRVAGTMGALMAISDLAKAETAGQRGMAGANLLEAVLPPGFMMGGAGAGSDLPPDMAQAMLLGSPYAQSEFAKKQRQEQEYVRKVGAGRGIAPPSAYQR